MWQPVEQVEADGNELSGCGAVTVQLCRAEKDLFGVRIGFLGGSSWSGVGRMRGSLGSARDEAESTLGVVSGLIHDGSVVVSARGKKLPLDGAWRALAKRLPA